jgi:hypothetical protein
MAKNSIRQMDIVAANNTDVGGISLAEGIMRPPAVNNSFREYSAELAQWLAEMSYPTVGGTADALTLTPTTALAALANNTVFTATIGASPNATTTPTLAVSGLAATVIRKMSGGVDVALAIGDLKALTPYAFIFKTAANAAAGAWIVLDMSFPTTSTDLGLLIDALSAKATPVDADEMPLSDSAAAQVGKKATFTQAWTNYFKVKADLLYQPLKAILTTLGNLANAAGVLTNDGSGNLSWATSSKRTLLATLSTASGSSVTSGTLATTYSSWDLEFDSVSSSSVVATSINISSDGGSTFDSAKAINGATGLGASGRVTLARTAITGNKIVTGMLGIGSGGADVFGQVFSTKTSPTNCVQIISGGTFNGGTVYVYGVP